MRRFFDLFSAGRDAFSFRLIVAVLVSKAATIGYWDSSPSRRRYSFSDSASDSAATVYALVIGRRSCLRAVGISPYPIDQLESASHPLGKMPDGCCRALGRAT